MVMRKRGKIKLPTFLIIGLTVDLMECVEIMFAFYACTSILNIFIDNFVCKIVQKFLLLWIFNGTIIPVIVNFF